MIFHVQAYASDKLYGKALNNHIQHLPDDCWVIVRDLDTLPLTSHAMKLCEQAIIDRPDVDLFTCATNRVYGQGLSRESDIIAHHDNASRLEMGDKKYLQIKGCVPAFFWLFRKSLWLDNPFDDLPIISGNNSFDARWTKDKDWVKVRICHLFIFHFYRLNKDKSDYSHLK